MLYRRTGPYLVFFFLDIQPLKHLGFCDVKARPGSKWEAASLGIQMDDAYSQISSSDSFYAVPDYPMDPYVSSHSPPSYLFNISINNPHFAVRRKSEHSR
jgi:hypothetical protein